MQEFEALRTRLQGRLSDMIGQQSRLEANLRHADGELSDDWEERAALLQNTEVWEALEASDRQEIQAIQAVLQAIKEGTYGNCQQCGEPIGVRRLEAVPYTRSCVNCA